MNIELHTLKNIWNHYILIPNQQYFGEYTEIFLFIIGSQVLHLISFWSHCILLAIIDLNPIYFSWFHQWKIQKDCFIDTKKYKKAIFMALFNQFFVNIPFAVVAYGIYTIKGGIAYDVDSFPTLGRLLLDFIGFIVIEELLFYYGHLWMHLPQYYASYHKQHHEFTAPVGVACIYAHPVEHVLCNLSPIVAGPLFMNSHLFSYWAWLTFAVFSTIVSHSGYHFPFLPSSERHDFHHLKFNVNYGPTGLLDWLCKTDTTFNNTAQQARNRVFFSLSDVQYMMQDSNAKVQ